LERVAIGRVFLLTDATVLPSGNRNLLVVWFDVLKLTPERCDGHAYINTLDWQESRECSVVEVGRTGSGP
jgi:hypothetical protein